jgi:immune inhibitor A
MRKPARRALGIVVAGLAVISLVAPTMAATPVADRGSSGHASRLDNHPGPLTERQNARRKAAQELILSGKASPDSDGVVKLGEDKYFQAAVTGTGKVFTILSEFGDQGTKKLGLVPGPLHNEITKPNRETIAGHPNTFDPALPYDNSRHWTRTSTRRTTRPVLRGR